MHCLLENQGPTHFCILLGLTSASAALHNPLNPAFSYNFVKIDDEDNTPNRMMQKEARSISLIHTLLTSPIKDDVGPLDHDNEEDYANLMDTAELTRCLMNKNTKPLQFVCEDLEVKPPERFRNSTMTWKKDCVAALVEWVSWPSQHCSLADQKTQRMTKPTQPVHLRPAKIGTPEVMQTVQDVISQTTVPHG